MLTENSSIPDQAGENEEGLNFVERPFKDGVSLFGYDRILQSTDGEIVGITGEERTLLKDMDVELVGDSKGYISSGHKSGDRVKIVGFSEPFKGGETDHIVIISGDGKTGAVKPSNIKL